MCLLFRVDWKSLKAFCVDYQLINYTIVAKTRNLPACTLSFFSCGLYVRVWKLIKRQSSFTTEILGVRIARRTQAERNLRCCYFLTHALLLLSILISRVNFIANKLPRDWTIKSQPVYFLIQAALNFIARMQLSSSDPNSEGPQLHVKNIRRRILSMRGNQKTRIFHCVNGYACNFCFRPRGQPKIVRAHDVQRALLFSLISITLSAACNINIGI